MSGNKRVIVALDSNNLEEINTLVDSLKNYIFGVKIGYEFFFNFGLTGYKKIQSKNINIFLDLKLHDIPNTVKKGIEAISKLKPYFTTVHISGGDKMLSSTSIKNKEMKILGISALTSLDDLQVKKYYFRDNVKQLTADYTHYAIENKLDGIVCSPLEIKTVKKIAGKKLIIVTPGIRPSSYSKIDDQKRFMTPSKAIALGANYIVIGRPITQSSKPINEIININSEIEKYKIKICGIKNSTILDCCNKFNVDYFGLNFYEKSPRYINIKEATELIKYQNNHKSIPVGVFVNYNFNYLSKLIKKTNLRNIQLHGNENNEYISKLKNKHKLTVIKAINISNKNDIKKIKLYSCADYFLFDYKPKKNELPGGNAQSFNWSILKNFNITKPWFIAGGINRNNINYIIENLIPYGIDISSGVEDQPGIKSPGKIKEIVEIING